MNTDILIVGSGCSGLYCAWNLPRDRQITIITKQDAKGSDSFFAQGGMCMLKDESDYESYFEDTMKAGHYENDRKSVEIMIRSSQSVVDDLLSIDVDFNREEDGSLAFTREGAHSSKRIVYHKDITGKEITGKLLAAVIKLPNVTLMSYTTLVDLITADDICAGAVVRKKDGSLDTIMAQTTVLATGGIGGLYQRSTNYRHLTGDAVALALKHGIVCKDINYVQIHPTTLYVKDAKERSFLISESVRGEGAKLYDKAGNRFVNELLPRDLLTEAIWAQMERDHTEFVWEDLRTIDRAELLSHFPNIVEHCKEMGYDVTKECIPVVPAQHYYMGGIQVNHESRTSMQRLYAIGETACNGVHGKNRLASNSLLESLVFAKRAAMDIVNCEPDKTYSDKVFEVDFDEYKNQEAYDNMLEELVKSEIERADRAEGAKKTGISA